MKRRGEILVENIIFIVLNLAFLTILTLFLFQQGSSGALLEDAYSKQIALIADSAKPNMIVRLNMKEALELAQENGIDLDKVVTQQDNFITVKLSERGGKSYPFFNDIRVNSYSEGEGIYVLTFAKNE